MAKKRARIADADLFQTTEEETPVNKPDSKSTNKLKIKNTYYFAPDTAYRLEKMQFELRHLTGEKLSKSEVIEAALLIALKEFESNPANSKIVDMLSNL